jgi:hypothetical protein
MAVRNAQNLKPAMVTGLLLGVAVLAFAGLAYQTVSVSTSSTVTNLVTEGWISYSAYMVIDTSTYTTTTSNLSTFRYTEWVRTTPCDLSGGLGCPPSRTHAVTYYSTSTNTFALVEESAYQLQQTAAVAETQTVTSSLTTTYSNYEPAYATLGLTGESFGGLAILMIGILTLLTIWIVLKSRRKTAN